MKTDILFPKVDIVAKNLGIARIMIIIFLLIVASIRFIYVKFFIIPINFSDAFKTFSRIKFFKYYVTSSVIGYISSEAIKVKTNFYKKLKYAFLTMDWGLLILAMDAVSDVEKASDEYCEELNLVCYKILCERIAQANPVYMAEFEDNINSILKSSFIKINGFSAKTPMSKLSLYLVSKINKKMKWVLPKDKHLPLKITLKALRECAILCKGQVDSFNQRKSNKNFDVKWYFENVICNKTIYIYSFIYFFAQSDEEGQHAINLGDALLGVNDIYLNRQLLDDLNDIVIDTVDGLFAGPSYLLCYDFNKPLTDKDDLLMLVVKRVIAEINDKEKLSNYSSIFRQNINRNPHLAISALMDSKIPFIIINIIKDEERYLPHYNKFLSFSNLYPRTIPLTTLFYYRCGKSLMKAETIVNRSLIIRACVE